ncbi:unnamed protein product [Eruca vesicaria subsp. sativa]|uniref:Uncharacterized protein n=1 Tax=Eruca vesicaria subsp. sativa TaxID=29727 RepID=A0ABC8JE33_ERUVS|nr:unnamed protein product [Eruca vesicaria subsp. sativa]
MVIDRNQGTRVNRGRNRVKMRRFIIGESQFSPFWSFQKDRIQLRIVDGELVVLEVDSGCIFISSMSKLIERRIIIGKMWFKLPYESLEDCKPLWEKVEFNKKKLGIIGQWYKEVDLYIENDVTGRETKASIPEKETEPSKPKKEVEKCHEDAIIE